MKPKALVVEDDDRIIDSIGDALFSIGHEHDWATNQQDAQQMLQAGEYTYVLMDLQIPAKPNRGGADKEFGANLLEHIQQTKGRGRVPVIIMTAHSSDCLDLTTELFANGASDFIAKPFTSKGRTLTKVIRKVLSEHEPEPSTSVPAAAGANRPDERPFAGGEMVFHANRIELCEVTILTDARSGQMRRILDELKQRNSAGRLVAYSGPELVAQTKCRSGQNGVAGCIRDFRKSVTEALCEQAGLVCGPQDVIRSGGPGYRLHEWITVRNAVAVDTGSNGRDPANDQSGPAIVPAKPDDDPASRRRNWILAELGKERKLRAPAIATGLGCSEKTVKRELDALRVAGKIEFVGPSKTGYYRLLTADSR